MTLLSKDFSTDIEKLITDELIKRGLRKGIDFSTQYPIKYSFILDFAFPDKKLAIEADGEPWHSTPQAKRRDKYRDNILKKQGWKVIRFWGNEIREDVEKVVDKILKEL